ncbi:M42 family metallopeptidase [Erysipelothrix urinaevulpis]|uniref:M42 family metallopeptidase n=1 Tax=Erysipelothrix urinaevulpis TaxID=2683717 RepID=UPI0013578F39|nr:M42 family peptidase [Erysipelothrix urinaevulpis]
MKEQLKATLKTLVEIPSVSGNEQLMVKHMYTELSKYADEVTIDKLGNVYASKKGKTEGPKMMIAAHVDQIGFSVKNILANGFILFDKVGTPSDRVMTGRKVMINGNIPGVIGIKSAHLESAAEKNSIKTAKESYIDIAANSKEEVEALGIRVGDRIEFVSDFTVMQNPDYVCTKSIDNRISCALLLELFKKLDDIDFAGEIVGVATVQEETGMKGAFVSGNNVDPDYAIVIDTIPSGDTPDINTEQDLPIRLGDGPVLVVGDGIMIGLLFSFSSQKVIDQIDKASKLKDVKLQEITLIGEGYATDAARLSFAGSGIPFAMLATPRRYTHSPIELMNMNDAVGTFEILCGLVEKNGEANLDFI